jgi:predicted XRE-type DNA-binding protein
MNDDPIPALKRQLGDELARLLEGWRASDICDRIGTTPARVSDLRRGKLERFSLETLIRCLAGFRRRVELSVVIVKIGRRGPASQ